MFGTIFLLLDIAFYRFCFRLLFEAPVFRFVRISPQKMCIYNLFVFLLREKGINAVLNKRRNRLDLCTKAG